MSDVSGKSNVSSVRLFDFMSSIARGFIRVSWLEHRNHSASLSAIRVIRTMTMNGRGKGSCVRSVTKKSPAGTGRTGGTLPTDARRLESGESHVEDHAVEAGDEQKIVAV